MPAVRPFLSLVLLALMVLAAPGDARAAASAWTENPDAGTRVRLISATEATGTADSLRLGLQFDLDPGWKVYWKSAGDAGYPPSILWDESLNLDGTDMAFPLPGRFTVLGLQSLGYEGEVVYPITARVAEPGAPLRLRARVEYLACAKVCIPGRADLALDLPAGPATPAPEAHAIDRARARVPGPGTAAGLSIDETTIGGSGEQRMLTVTATARPPLTDPDLFVVAPELTSFGVPKVDLAAGGARATLRVPVEVTPGAEVTLAGKPLTVLLADGDRGLETEVIPAATAATAATATATPTTARRGLAVALFGLNFKQLWR